MTINTENVPVKPSNVSVLTTIRGSERFLGTRFDPTTSAPKTVALPITMIIDAVSANVTVNLQPSGVSAGTYGTSLIIPRFVVGTDGRITSVIRTTIEAAQNVFANVSASAGSIAATSASDSLQVYGDGSAISTSITGHVLTVYHDQSGVSAGTYGTSTIIPQFIVDDKGHITSIVRTTIPAETPRLMWSTISASSGSTSADVSADNLAIRGDSTHISTSITGDILTIYQVSSGASSGTYGTSLIVPQFTVDGNGVITAINRVTAPPFLAKVSTSTSTFSAVSANSGDTLHLRGGTGVCAAITGGVLTLDLRGSGVSTASGTYGTSSIIPQITVDQFGRITGVTRVTVPPFFAKVSTSTSTITAVSGNSGDTLNIRGAAGVNIKVSSGIVLISQTCVLAAGVTTVGTSSIIPQITTDGTGRITAITPVTVTPFLSKVSCSTSTYQAVSAATGDTLNIRGGTGVCAAIAGGILTLALRGSGVSTASGTYGTSSIIPQITVDQFGRITNVARITVNPFFAKVSTSTSTLTAVSAAAGDTLNIRGRGIVDVKVSGGIVCVSVASGGAGISNAFTKVSTSTSSYTASGSDTLNIRGKGAVDIKTSGGVVFVSVATGGGSGITALVSASDVSLWPSTTVNRYWSPEIGWDNNKNKYTAQPPFGIGTQSLLYTDFNETSINGNNAIFRVLGNGTQINQARSASFFNNTTYTTVDDGVWKIATNTNVSVGVALILGVGVSTSTGAGLGTSPAGVFLHGSNKEVFEIYSRFMLKQVVSLTNIEYFVGFSAPGSLGVSAHTSTVLLQSSQVTGNPFVGVFHSNATTTFQLISYTASNTYTTVDTGIVVSSNVYYNVYLRVAANTVAGSVSTLCRINGIEVTVVGLQPGVGFTGPGSLFIPYALRVVQTTGVNHVSYSDLAMLRKTWTTTRGVW